MYSCQVKCEVCNRIASNYLPGTAYLRTTFFGGASEFDTFCCRCWGCCSISRMLASNYNY